MKRWFWIFLTLLLLALPAARAESAVCTGRVRADMPPLTVTVTASGAFNDASDRPLELIARISAADGTLTQEIAWWGNEGPDPERAAALVMFVDYNFDGYADLQLLTAAGARNALYNFALWNPAEGRFDPVMTMDGKVVEVCNPLFYADRRQIRSVIQDGWRYHLDILLAWQDERTLVERVIAEVYYPDVNGCIGERLTIVDGNERRILWDQQYTEDWYYGMAEGSTDHRSDALLQFTKEGRSPFAVQVSHEDWVYLRSLDSIHSTPLAQIPHGETVYVLQSGIGPDGGWVLVWYPTPASGADTLGWVGYVWHSYLGPWPLRVTGADWVYIREAPDKQSSAITELDSDTLVWPCGEAVDGWVPVSVNDEDCGSLTGYIWHSFLAETEQ